MDSLIKQMTARFSNVGQGNPEESRRRTPLQKTQSFKGEKKRAPNWLRRLFSRQMSGEFDPNTQMERATAVAAAAYAINKSLEESRIPQQKKIGGVPPQPSLSKKEDISEQKKTSDGPEPAMSRQKSTKEDKPVPITEPGRVPKWFSGANARASSVSPDRNVPVTDDKDDKAPEKAIDSTPTKPKRTRSKVTDPGPSSIKKTPTFDDEGLNRDSSKKPEGAMPKIDLPHTRPGRTQSKPDIPSPGPTETQADAWEKAEMAKIKERYEKLNETIRSWEERRKKKARRKLNTAEGKLEKRRVKAWQKFRSDVETIDQIARGATAQAQDNQINEELKAKEKANVIRTTGKVPATTCFCF